MLCLSRRQRCCVCHYDRFYLKQKIRSICSSSSNIVLSNDLLIHESDSDSCVQVEGNANSRTVILNRPSVLNALNAPMLKSLHKLYESWEANPDVAFVVMKGNGNAFCSGGDIVSMYEMIKKGNMEGSKEIFRRAYKLIYLLHTFTKPNVAILDGITMGGGAGVSITGTFQIVFATPETLIGLHPDGGASFYLSRLPGYLGEYLGLTGDRLNGLEMKACGLATHYSHTSNIALIEDHLRNLMTNDPCVIQNSMTKYCDVDHLHDNSVLRRLETINRCFCHDNVEEIIEHLVNVAANTKNGWCRSVLNKLKRASPLSLKISLRSIREGRFQTLGQCLIREYRLTSRVMSCSLSSNFCEGVRARMVDKDFAPKWDPPSLEHVTRDMVDWYFSPLGALEPELDLPRSVYINS